jgi:hypothetical protein
VPVSTRPRRLVPGAVLVAAFVALSAAPSLAASERQTIRSRPDLKPPKIKVGVRAPSSFPGDIFLTPRVAKRGGTNGPLVVDARGRVVWYHPLPKGRSALGLEPQRYKGRPVLTWGERSTLIKPADVYKGEPKSFSNVIASDRYRLVKRVRAVGKDVRTDLHDFKTTSRGTALVLGFRFVDRDLRRYGGPRDGKVIDCLVQVVDVKTNKLLFNWRAINHVPLSDSYAKPIKGAAFDYFHVNSVGLDTDGNLLVTARHTFAVYKISRKTGKTIWQLGGKRSSFKMGKGASFAYQHDAQRLADGTLLIFDNAAAEFDARAKESRAVRLRLDTKAKTAKLVRSYRHGGKKLLATSQGNARVLPNGNVFVGWGKSPWFSEFTSDGKMVFDGRFPSASYQSYKAFRGDWHARPDTRPVLAASRKSGVVTAYTSWNGATEVATWQLLAGASPSRVGVVASVPWRGLETKLTAPTTAAYVSVRALDARGRSLGIAKAVKPKAAR